MPQQPDPLNDPTIRLARDFVRVPSVTPVDAKDLPQAREALKIAAQAACASGATATWLNFSDGHPKWDYQVENLYLEWQFRQAAKHLCFIGHLDVVPPGDLLKWSDDPYSGAISNGYLYGRGATDMKGCVAAFMTAVAEAMPDLKKQGNLKVSVILTTDEEWAAVNGTDKVLQWMKARGDAPDAFIVGEPSSQDSLASHIKVGRRGSLVGILTAHGVQGHAAYQELFENPNRALTLAAAVLNSHGWSDGNENFPNTNFEVISLRSGDPGATAIVPGQAELVWNIRFTPAQTPESLESWIKDSLANPPAWAKAHPDFALLAQIEVKANKDTASHPYYRAPAGLAAAARDAIQEIVGSKPKMDGSGGTTDGRFAAKLFAQAEIIELGLPERGGMVNGQKDANYLLKGGMHQLDERAALDDLTRLRRIFSAILKNYGR